MNIPHIPYVFILISLLLSYIYIFLQDINFITIKKYIMKKIFVLSSVFAAMLAITSCGSSKTVQAPAGDVSVYVPCSGLEYKTNNEYFRANAMGLSSDMNIAKQKAMSAARTQLAQSIETTVKAVTDDYASSYQDGENEEGKRRFQELGLQATKQKLSGIRTICEETMRTPEGKYKVYVAIELSGNEIKEAMANRISNDDKLRIDFEYEKFKKVFDEEMKNYNK